MDVLLLKIINMSIAASWLILTVIFLRAVLKKVPKWINVLLWGIVAIRLVSPFNFESSVSLIPDAIGSGELVSQWTDDYIGDIDIYHPNSIYYDAAISAGREPISDGEGGYYVVTKHDQLGESSTIENTVIPVLTVVWLTGIMAMLIYATGSYFRLKKKIGASLYRNDNIWISDDIQTPFILGTIKPRIYIPSGTEEAQLPHIIAHENAHLKRRDHWWKPLGFLVLALHWFNPLVWVAYILLCRDIELACDEKVVRNLNQSESIAYSEALLSCSMNRRTVMVCPLAFGEVGVKERVKRVLNYKKPAFWIVGAAVILSIILAVCFLTNPKQDSFRIRITIPAGTTREIIYPEDFVYSDEEISPLGNKITITSGDGLGDTEVVLMPIQVKGKNAYEPKYLTPEMPVEMDVEKGVWFKIGINMQNPTVEDMVVYVEVDGIEVRVEDEVIYVFQAEILEIHDDYYLVQPMEGSWERSSTDRIEVPIKNAHPSPEPEVGDIIEIEYFGDILESYPAQITNVHRISVVNVNESNGTESEEGAKDSFDSMEYTFAPERMSFTEVTLNTLPHVTMKMEKYKSWEGDIEISNQSGKELQTWEGYDIQKWENGEWHKLALLTDGLWEDILYRIPAGETTIFPTNWKTLYGDLPNGKYRIIKEIYETVEDETHTHYLAVEFEL